MKEIQLIQKTLDNIENEDETIDMLKKAAEYYCGNYDLCFGYKEAIMLTVSDQYNNHYDEQNEDDLKRLLNLLK